MEIPIANIMKYQSLYAFFKTDFSYGSDAYGWRLAESIISNVFARMRIDMDWREDCRQEIITAWLTTTFDLKRPRQEIIAYAARAAVMAVQAWRREVIVTTYAQQRQSPEPTPVYLDELFGEDLDRFVEATLSQAGDPATEFTEQDEELFQIDISQIKIPEGKNSAKIKEAMLMMWNGASKEEAAETTGVTVRTINRWLVSVRNENSQVTRRELAGEGAIFCELETLPTENKG